ncbi:MAG: maltose acetyltransferase domain-containing protein [Hydrogeniiclostridium mannosilyticum]
MFDFNHTRPGDTRTKRRILEELLGSVGRRFGWSLRSISPMAATPISGTIFMPTLI